MVDPAVPPVPYRKQHPPPWWALGAACAFALVLLVILCIWTPWGGSIPIGGTDLLAEKGLRRGLKIIRVEYSPDAALTWDLKEGRSPDGSGWLPETYTLTVPDDARVIGAIVRILRHARKAWPRPLLVDGMTIRVEAEDGTVVDVFLGRVIQWNVVYLEESTYASKSLARILRRVEEEKRGYSKRRWSPPAGSTEGR